MSKSQKNETEVKIDEDYRAEAEQNMAAARFLAGMGTNPYTGATLAGLSKPTMASFRSIDDLAKLWGMEGKAEKGANKLKKMGDKAGGMITFSPEQTMQQQGAMPPDFMKQLEQFYALLGGGLPAQQPVGASPNQGTPQTVAEHRAANPGYGSSLTDNEYRRIVMGMA